MPRQRLAFVLQDGSWLQPWNRTKLAGSMGDPPCYWRFPSCSSKTALG